MKQNVLVNYWYAEQVGHAIEGLRYCLGYHAADPSLPVSLLLNSSTAIELVQLCAFVKSTFAVSYPFAGSKASATEALRGVPKDWGWIVDDPRRLDSLQLASFPNMREYYVACDRHFRAECKRGIAGQCPPEYKPNQQ